MSGHNINVYGTLNVVGGNQTNIGMPQLEGITVPGLLTGPTGATTLAGRLITDAPFMSGSRRIPRLTPLFTGREDVLKQLAQWFDPTQPSIALKLQRVFVLYGPGGAGKTQIMAKFVNEFSDRFSGVYYVDGSTLETIKGSLEDIVRYTLAGETSEDALRWFAQQRTEWLLLIDNADDPDINLRQFLPACTHGNIIITSRNRACRQHAPDSNCNVVGMACATANAKYPSSLHIEADRVRFLVDRSAMDDLRRNSMASSGSGAYIAQSCALDDYLELYHADRARLLQIEPVQTVDDYQGTVYTTWEMNLKKLSSTATAFLRLCAFMHHEGISRDIFKFATTANSAPGSFEEGRRFLDNFRSVNGEWNNQNFIAVVKELASYSLINVDAEAHVYSMHPLIHSFARECANLSECEAAKTCTLQILALSVPSGYDADMYALRRSLFPHVDVCRSGEITPDAAERLVDIYSQCGRWQAVEELQMVIIEAKKQLFDDEHPDVIRALGNLATTYGNQGRWKEAEKLELQVLATLTKLLGREHPDTIRAMGNLACTYRERRQWDKAEELDLQVVEMRKRLLGDEHPHTIIAMANLACTYQNQARWNEAEELHLQVMATRRRVLSDEHPHMIRAKANLASTYQHQGRLKEAEELELEVMATTKRLFGDEHPDTLRAMGNLAITYQYQERWTDAQELELEVMATRKRLLGDEHPHTRLAMANLACTYQNQGRWNEAEELELEVLEMSKRLLGDEHCDTIQAMSNLAQTYQDQARWNEAEDLRLQVLATRKKLLGDEHPDTIQAMVDLAWTNQNQGRWDETEELELEVLAMRKKLLGDEHPDTILATANLACTYRIRERWNEAEGLELQVMVMREKLLGDEHPDTILATTNLATTYQNQGRWNEAERLGLQVLATRKKLLGDEHSDTILAMAELAYTYRSLGRWKQAQDLDLRVLEVQRRVLGDDHPDTLASTAHLARTYTKKQRFLPRLRRLIKLS